MHVYISGLREITSRTNLRMTKKTQDLSVTKSEVILGMPGIRIKTGQGENPLDPAPHSKRPLMEFLQWGRFCHVIGDYSAPSGVGMICCALGKSLMSPCDDIAIKMSFPVEVNVTPTSQ